MHDLATIVRLNNEAAERLIARDLGRAVIADHDPDAPGAPVNPGGAGFGYRSRGPGRPFGLAQRLRKLRAALLAVTAALLYGCGPEAPADPDRSDPFPPPAFSVHMVRYETGPGVVVVRRIVTVQPDAPEASQ